MADGSKGLIWQISAMESETTSVRLHHRAQERITECYPTHELHKAGAEELDIHINLDSTALKSADYVKLVQAVDQNVDKSPDEILPKRRR